MTLRPSAARRIGATTLAVGLAAALAGNILTGSAAGAATAEVEEHLTEATKNSGGDLDLINRYRTYSCDATEDPGMYDRTSQERHATRVPLTQVFDDLWYIGDMYVGQYILRTKSGGFVLIDSLNNSAEVDEYTIPALKSLGLGADHPLEAVLLSHGHGDHDGGANRLRALFGGGLDIYIGSADAVGKTYSPKLVDSSSSEPQEITIGGTTVVLQSIPGHTPGALNFVVPVHQDGRQHNLLMGGRQGHPKPVASARGYLTGTERTYRLVAEYAVEGTFLTHPTSDGSTVNMQAIVRTGTRSPNPFLIGHERALRAAAIWRGCAAAWLANVDPTADVPVWRVTSLQLSELKPHTNVLSARLMSGWGASEEAGWGAVAGQNVTLTTAAGASCTAVTDATGLATCTTSRALRPNEDVTASFAGSSTAQVLTLASEASTRVPVQ